MSATPPAEVPTASEHADIEATTLAAESSLLGALRPPYTPQGGSASREAGPPRRNPKTDVFCLNHDSRPKMGCLFICQNLIAISMKPGRAYVVAVRASIERPKLSASVPTEISLRLGPNRYLTRVAIEELLLEAGPNITRAVRPSIRSGLVCGPVRFCRQHALLTAILGREITRTA